MAFGFKLVSNTTNDINLTADDPSYYVVSEKMTLNRVKETFTGSGINLFRPIRTIYNGQKPLSFVNIPIGKSIFLYNQLGYQSATYGITGGVNSNWQNNSAFIDPMTGSAILQLAASLYSDATTISIVNCVNSEDLGNVGLEPQRTDYGFAIFSPTPARVVTAKNWSNSVLLSSRPVKSVGGTSTYTATIYYKQGTVASGGTGGLTTIPPIPTGGSYTFNPSTSLAYDSSGITPPTSVWKSTKPTGVLTTIPIYACDYTFITTEAPNNTTNIIVTAVTWGNLRIVSQLGSGTTNSIYEVTMYNNNWGNGNIGYPSALTGGNFDFVFAMATGFNGSLKFSPPALIGTWEVSPQFTGTIYKSSYTFINDKGGCILSNESELLNVVATTSYIPVSRAAGNEHVTPSAIGSSSNVIIPSLTIDGAVAKPFICLDLLGLEYMNATGWDIYCTAIYRVSENTYRVSKWNWLPALGNYTTNGGTIYYTYNNNSGTSLGTTPFARFNYGS